MLKIDLGCGRSKKDGFIGVDCLGFDNVDIVHDLNKFPYPFSDNEVDEVYMDNVLEHLKNPIKVIDEIYRISKNKAIITISVPYFRSFYSVIDPTHKSFFGVFWFYYFYPKHPFFDKYSYSKSMFNIKKIEFDREWKNSKMSFIHKMIVNFAEKNPDYYERKISHIIPLNSLTFHLEVIKE